MPPRKHEWSTMRVGQTRTFKARGDAAIRLTRCRIISSVYAYRRGHDRKFRIATKRTKVGIVAKRIK